MGNLGGWFKTIAYDMLPSGGDKIYVLVNMKVHFFAFVLQYAARSLFYDIPVVQKVPLYVIKCAYSCTYDV